MSDIMEILFKRIKVLLTGLTVAGEAIPFYVTTFTRGEKGVYISAYSESDNSLKQQFGADVTMTITCFADNGTIDDVNSIAKAVQNILYPNKNQNMTIGDDWKVTIQNQASKVLMPDEKMAEITYNFLIDVKH